MLDIKKIFNQENIIFWIGFGTLLGIVRENDFLDWDDNINILVYKEDIYSKLDILKNKFNSLGFIFRIIPKPKSIKINLHRYKHKNSIEGLFLDPLYLDNKYRLSNKFKHPRKFFEEYGTINFKNHIFRVPSPVKKYLKFLYKNWKIPVKSNIPDHKWRNKESRK